jgi:hypothetical protein
MENFNLNIVKSYATQLVDYLRLKGYAFNYLDTNIKGRKRVLNIIKIGLFDDDDDDFGLCIFTTKTPKLKDGTRLHLRICHKNIYLLDNDKNILHTFENYFETTKEQYINAIKPFYDALFIKSDDVLKDIVSNYDSYVIGKDDLKNLFNGSKTKNIKSLSNVVKMADIISNCEIPLRYIEDTEMKNGEINLYFGASILSWVITVKTDVVEYTTLNYGTGGKNGEYVGKGTYRWKWDSNIKKMYSNILKKVMTTIDGFFKPIKSETKLNDDELECINEIYKGIVLRDHSDLFNKLK